MKLPEWAKPYVEAWHVSREAADSGVEFDDERLDYVSVQIDRDTWNRLRALHAR